MSEIKNFYLRLNTFYNYFIFINYLIENKMTESLIMRKIKNSNVKLTDIGTIFKNKQSDFFEKLNILLVNLPCNGFGDIIFATRFKSILQKMYKFKVNILTTQKKSFIDLGENGDDIFELIGSSKNLQCRRLNKLKISDNIPIFDIIFVAPLQMDFEPKLSDIQSLIPYSNKFNTFFLSEYNDSLRKKGIYFHTGIGGDRCGLLFDDIDTKSISLQEKILNPYSVVYIQPDIGQYKNCLENFLRMILPKYNDKNFEIVLPNWVGEKEKYIKRIVELAYPYYKTIFVKTKSDLYKYLGDNTTGNKLYYRLDIYPLPNKNMRLLLENSVTDTLITGDQSLTDVLACCVDKNIFYQIVPWKENFAKQLANEMPNRWLYRKRTACGTLKAIKYKSKYTTFKKKWDFRIRAKPKLDGIFYFHAEKKYNQENSHILQKYQELAESSRTVKSFIKKWLNE